MYEMNGYQAALVLRDEKGEFEVGNAFAWNPQRDAFVIDVSRVEDACDAREMSQVPGRPVF